MHLYCKRYRKKEYPQATIKMLFSVTLFYNTTKVINNLELILF